MKKRMEEIKKGVYTILNKKEIEYISEKLANNKEVNIEQVNILEIDNVDNIKIDGNKSSIERILDFLVYTKNPYVIRKNDTIIRMQFRNDNRKANECVTRAFKKIYVDNF